MIRLLLTTSLVATALAARVAAADPAPPIATYAIVVGSNAGGPGQAELRYAEDDARRVAAVLTELGGYAPAAVDVIVHPTPSALREHITRVATLVAADAAAGRQSRVFFYYSGHARAEAIDLGSAELPLAELRTRLLQIPSTLTVVVLDACQSGAFSRVKGAAPAADFSYNSRQKLDARGVAVLASSSGSELSQESERLRSSYFTHHLLVGLRGAGDANHDGQVSVDEAYHYAYNQTLLATTATAVGGQHVSLEVELQGHGDVALSYPRAATASIELPGAMAGQATVEDRRAHAVVAEIQKARGTALRIAVAPGDYQVLVRHDDVLSRCDVTTTTGTAVVELARCRDEAIVDERRKGGERGAPGMRLEVGVTLGGERHDAYTQRLADFGYSQDLFPATGGLTVVGMRQLNRWLWVGLAGAYAPMAQWRRSTELSPLRLDWSTTTLVAVAEGRVALPSRAPKFHPYAFARVGAGLGVGRTHFRDEHDATSDDTYLGPAVLARAGFDMQNDYWPSLGVQLAYELDYAPVIDNLVGDTHGSGGHRVGLALTYQLGGSR